MTSIWKERSRKRSVLGILLILLGLLMPVVVQAQATELISHISATETGNYDCLNSASISGDGRFVAFFSRASSNAVAQIYVFDRQAHTTEMVSVSSSGVPASDVNFGLAISNDGRFVAFASLATNLVAGDTNGQGDIFVRDRQTRTTDRVNVGTFGSQASGGISSSPSLSADGRYVAFTSSATNLVSGDTNGKQDAFVYDRQAHTTERVSLSSSGAQMLDYPPLVPVISGNGRFVAFASHSSQLVSNTQTQGKIFVHDRQTHTTELVSVSSSGEVNNDLAGLPSISADGRYVAFQSMATNLVPNDTNAANDIYVHDRQTHTTEQVSVSNTGEQTLSISFFPGISADGRYVVFLGTGGLIPGLDAAGMYVHDRVTHTNTFASVTSTGDDAFGENNSKNMISDDGQYVPFTSEAINVVPGVTKGTRQTYLRGPLFPPVAVISGTITLEECQNSVQPLTFEFRPSDNSGNIQKTATLDTNGSFSLTGIPKKSFIVWIKGDKWLAKTVAVNASNGNVSNVNATLLAGDANDDNSVDVLDLDALIQAFDTTNGGAADFNCDGSVDVLDLDLLIRNFDQTGDA